MLREKLLAHPSDQLENAVSDIIDKYRDIIQLEKVHAIANTEHEWVFRDDARDGFISGDDWAAVRFNRVEYSECIRLYAECR